MGGIQAFQGTRSVKLIPVIWVRFPFGGKEIGVQNSI